MAAGLGFKTFTTGEVLTSADVNGYLMQGVLVFADAAARDAAITSPQEGQFAYLKDTDVTTYYTSSAWANLDTTGMTNPMTTTADMIYSSSGSTPERLGIGTVGQVLTVNSGATAPEWAAPSSTPTFAGCVLTKSVGQTIANSTTVDVTWDVEELDTNGFHSTVTNTDRVTIPSGYAGKYLVTAQLCYGNFSGGSNRLAVIYKNTTQVSRSNVGVTRGTPFASYTCSMSEGDYFKVAAFQDSGSSNTLEGNNFSQGATIFQVIYLGV
jgi:hypothetical protein